MYTYYATTETCTENKFQLARIDWLFRGPAIILYKTTTSITQNLSSFPSKQQIMCSSHQKTKSSPIWYPPPPKGPQILLVNQPEFCLRFTLLLCFVLSCFVLFFLSPSSIPTGMMNTEHIICLLHLLVEN
jgi:hypothetical protein